VTAPLAPVAARAVITKARSRSKVPLAVGGILSMPLFFAALMAMSLAVEKPTVHHLLKNGKAVVELGDPSGGNEAAVWLLAFATGSFVLVVGAAAIFAGRAGVPVAALAAIAAAVVIVVPLGGWADRHTDRYPVGVDLIPSSAGSEDIYLRGEWEDAARTTANQLGLVTVSMGGFAIALFLALELRRRRRGTAPAPPPPPPPPVVEGGPHIAGERASL
jgi:hypothetical protein